jgi:hypothetical protein
MGKRPDPTTPKTPELRRPTPASAKLLGTKKATAAAVRKHATASNTSVHRMLERLMDTVMENQPRSVEEKKCLLNALANQLVSYHRDPTLLERKSFSTLTKDVWDSIAEEIHLNYKGAIHSSKTRKLLHGIPGLPQSFLEQLKEAKSVSVSDVCVVFFHCANI